MKFINLKNLTLALIFSSQLFSSQLFSSQLFSSQINFDGAPTCILGSPKLLLYADLMEKTKFSEDDSFQKEYYLYRLDSSHFEERIAKSKIMCSMKNIPYVPHNRIICKDSQSNGYQVQQTPCVTEDMIDYVYWGINEALRCFSDFSDDYSEEIIFNEIHHESSFGFFIQYGGGDGIMQLVSDGKDAMYRQNQRAHSFLVKHLFSHSEQCSSFQQLFFQTPSESNKKYSACTFTSLGDGIGRNLLGGIGLYFYYRSATENPRSAENILANWGYKKTNSNMYKKVRAYLTAGMYNKGPNAVYNQLNNKIKPKSLSRLSEKQKYNTVMKLIERSSFISYIRGIERSSKIFDSQGNCTLSTSDELAYQH